MPIQVRTPRTQALLGDGMNAPEEMHDVCYVNACLREPTMRSRMRITTLDCATINIATETHTHKQTAQMLCSSFPGLNT